MNATTDRELSAIREAAVDWVIQLNDNALPDSQRKAFTEWLCRSPTHVGEYLRAEEAWRAMAGVAKADRTDVRQVLPPIAPNVLELPARGVEAGPAPRPRYVARLGIAFAASIVVGVAGLFGPQIIQTLDPNAYATDLGEMRQIALSDGSSIELNTRSRIRVSMSKHSREIYLLEGEAYFKVGKDPSRPFRVRSGDAVIHALGTQFNVYRKSTGTAVTVVEGLVSVAADAKSSPPSSAAPSGLSVPEVKLKAGEGAFVDREIAAANKRRLRAAPVDSRRAVSWRQQRLVFENEALADVVLEFNRYNSEQLVIDDPALGATRVSGVFSAKRPLALVDFLTQHGDVRATELSGSRVLLSRPD